MELTYKQLIPKKRVGTKLQDARISAGFSLDYVAKKLRINKEYIEAIESNQFTTLPFAPLYQKKLITSYAKAMNMKTQKLLGQFVYEELHEQKSKKILPGKKTYSFRSFNLPLIIKVATVMLCVGSFFGYLAIQVKQIVQPPQLLVYSPKDGLITQDSLLHVQGKVGNKAAVMINGKMITNSEDGFFSQKLTLSEGLNMIVLTARKKHGKIQTDTRHVIYKKPQNISAADESDIFLLQPKKE